MTTLSESVLDLFRIEGKRALVTGCKRGIGKAIAMALAEAGADIVGVSRSLELQDSQVERDVIARGQRFWAYRCDFAKRTAVHKLANDLEADGHPIDILVNNAGTILRRPAAEHPDDYWDTVIETNLNSQFILTREIAHGMLQRASGKIIFIASLLSFQGGINVPGYAASKGAIAQLTKALANEWSCRGIQVNAIAPGYISTENTLALREDPQRSASILGRIPSGRWGKPEDLAGAAVFLASRAADYVNGTTLVVDGGWLGR